MGASRRVITLLAGLAIVAQLAFVLQAPGSKTHAVDSARFAQGVSHAAAPRVAALQASAGRGRDGGTAVSSDGDASGGAADDAHIAPSASAALPTQPQPRAPRPAQLNIATEGVQFGSVKLPPAPARLTVAFSNVGMKAYALNWLLHARAVPALWPYLLVSLDAQMHAEAERLGEPSVPAELLHKNSSLVLKRQNSWIRNDVVEFKKLGKVKALFTEQLLTLGYDVLLSDVDSVFLADPGPYLGGAMTPHLAEADLLVTNDYADAARDLDQSTVFNTGALMLRAGPRAIAFVREWAVRTERTGLIGNDQTELNRLLVGQYRDDDYSCTTPECLQPRKESVRALAVYAAVGPDATPCPEPAAAARADGGTPQPPPCVWSAEPAEADGSTGLTRVDVRTARGALADFEARQRELRREVPAGARRVPYWMWGGRVRVGLLSMGHFMQGHTFFVQHLHEQWATQPVHVHVTYTQSGDFGKKLRLRSAGLWQAESAEYYSSGDFVHVVGMREALLALLQAQPFAPGVWACAPGERPSRFFDGLALDGPELRFARPAPHASAAQPCYHPSRLVPEVSTGPLALSTPFETLTDPAAAHVRSQHLTRLVLRNALALSSALGRRLVLPALWCLCDRYWWQLRDCRMPGALSLPLPFECPLDNALNIDDWERLPPSTVRFVEAAFLRNKRTHAQISAETSAATLRVARDGATRAADPLPDAEGMWPPDGGGATLPDAPVVSAPSGATIESLVDALAANPRARASRVLRVSAASLLRIAPCGFAEPKARTEFERAVLQHAFGGQHSYCSSERNPNLGLVMAEAKRAGLTEEHGLLTRRNCTGNPANAFNKPKVDLGPDALKFAPECAPAGGSGAGGAVRSVAAHVFDTVLRNVSGWEERVLANALPAVSAASGTGSAAAQATVA